MWRFNQSRVVVRKDIKSVTKVSFIADFSSCRQMCKCSNFAFFFKGLHRIVLRKRVPHMQQDCFPSTLSFFCLKPIKFLICVVGVLIAVEDAKAPQ